ncbi:unnamed protein product [Plutella xylostella]|uniref:(diamondback moth) hypothetical protein n=1 Tax=Plutella xylostella TaxID=51655 RepID=A0A8S4FJG7_PLUXY|nr:unnamed protein product [Plutella xylostella]
MDNAGVKKLVTSMKGSEGMKSEESDDEVWDSDDDDDTIARIQRAHYAATAAAGRRRPAPAPRPRAMSQKRKMEAVKTFQDFTKRLKKDTGIRIRGLVGNNVLELADFSSEEEAKSDSDGLSEEEFVVNPSAVEELDEENESYIDPETGDIVERKKTSPAKPPPKAEVVEDKPTLQETPPPEKEKEIEKVEAADVDEGVDEDPLDTVAEEDGEPEDDETADMEGDEETENSQEPQTLSINDILNEGNMDREANVEMLAEVEGSECTEKTAEELLGMKAEETSQDQDYDGTKDPVEGEKPAGAEGEDADKEKSEEQKAEGDDDKKAGALNVRRNIREVMDEKQLDASTLAAQRQESERLARVQEQQRIIREVQRQIAINRQNKVHQKTMSLLQGGSSILKKGVAGNKLK